MTALSRAGWLTSAAVFGGLLVSIARVDFAGPVPLVLLVAVAAFACARPAWALPLVMGLVPFVWYGASQLWNAQIGWAEALVCASLAGLGVDAVRAKTAVPRRLAAPAAVLGAIVAAALAASLHVLALRGGPAFWSDLQRIAGRQYFTDHSMGALHAAMLLLEGVLLFAHAARLGQTPGVLRRVCGATALGSAVAAICTFRRLAESAARAPSFWTALVDLASLVRLNVTILDPNAAGSYFALALLAGAGLVVRAPRARRALWSFCAVCAALGLWLTSSRIAVIAVPAAAAGALSLPLVIRGRRQAALAGVAALAALALLAGVAVLLPQRGIQKSSLLAADTRLGLIQTGMRMIAAYPAFGIGLGEFQQRSGEFSSPDLLAKFPAAVHENAHNNVVQVAAETGIAGGIAFVWTIVAALAAVAWRATADRDRPMQFVLAALVAFALTALAGHPLLVPEAAFAFWILLGTAAGAAVYASPSSSRWPLPPVIAAAAIAVVALTLPLRLGAAARDADLEHIGIGVSGWGLSPDGIRYREASGHATLFVPVGAYKFSVNSRSNQLIRLEVTIDGRLGDIVPLAPGRWIDIVIPGKGSQSDSRHRRMDLRTLDQPSAIIWLTKDEPVLSR